MGELYPTVPAGVVPSADRVIRPQAERQPNPDRGRSQGMDGIRELLDAARDHQLVPGHFRGLLHIAIGRKVTHTDGTVVSNGMTWRELAGWLKQLRFDRELVRELGADPDALAPRDRERFWYSAIAAARVDTREAVTEAEALAARLKPFGFVVGPSPAALAAAPSPPTLQAKAKPAESKAKPKETPQPKRKKK